MNGRLLVLFLDGVGLGENDPDTNPIVRADLPVWDALFPHRPTLEHPQLRSTDPELPAVTFPVDANLGHDGIPQSGTGQTTLLTGRNGAELFGRHFGPWVPTALRPIVEEESFLRRALDRGFEVAFANAYPEDWPGPRGGRRIAGPPLAARAAGLLTRTHTDLYSGDAISSGITNEGWREHFGLRDLPWITPTEAGANLAALAGRHHLTLYAHWATDTAGHRGGMTGGVEAIERVNAFLGGVLEARPKDLSIFICSDHGNLEDVDSGHTRNPSLGVLIGPAVRDFDPATLDRLARIPAFVLGQLGDPPAD